MAGPRAHLYPPVILILPSMQYPLKDLPASKSMTSPFRKGGGHRPGDLECSVITRKALSISNEVIYLIPQKHNAWPGSARFDPGSPVNNLVLKP